MIHLYSANDRLVAVADGLAYRIDMTLDEVFSAESPFALLMTRLAKANSTTAPANPRAPIQSQEVWAAGVTYYRSRTARIEESATAGGGSFYDRVYHAERPELFSSPPPTASPAPASRCESDAIPSGTCPNPSSPSRLIPADASSVTQSVTT